MNLYQELEYRGFLNQFSSPDIFEKFDAGNNVLYFGVDPTADSMHIGNFVVFMTAIQYMKRGNKLIVIVGGATGMIGDPGGKDSERSFLDEATLGRNVTSLQVQVQTVLSHLQQLSGHSFEFEVINNLDFYREMNVLSFYREVGKFMTVNQMMSKETVKKRIEDPDKSISYTEFSYMLLQAYDYWKLYKTQNVTLQIGGSDQWGNLVTGVELIRKKEEQEVYCATAPLILASNGKKFGKSEGNAIWLDKTKNTPYFVYQYFMNTADEDVERFLKLFTLLSPQEITDIVTHHYQNLSAREGQKALARYVVEVIFGKEDSELAEKISEFLFHGEDRMSTLRHLTPSQLNDLGNAIGKSEFTTGSIIDVLVSAGVVESKSQARREIEAKSIYVNEVLAETTKTISEDDLVNGVVLIRKGKKSFTLLLA